MAGDKVKFVVMFRGRERSHTEFGYELLDKVQEDLKDLVKLDSRPSAEGRNLIMVLAPDAAGIKVEKARLEKERVRLEQEELAEKKDEDQPAAEAEETVEPEPQDQPETEAEEKAVDLGKE